MPPGTGGRGSYGHRHPGQEEVYLVVAGTLTFKVGDEVFGAGPRTAVKMSGDEFYSVHNDTDEDAELVIFSTRLENPPGEKQEDFWPRVTKFRPAIAQPILRLRGWPGQRRPQSSG